ncbi:hypothetical protein BGY98DRAFT_1017634, partial [Russula aff. rugulosa BPL654]
MIVTSRMLPRYTLPYELLISQDVDSLTILGKTIQVIHAKTASDHNCVLNVL